ncbi:MAG TPA: BPL-N domain-containing protein [Rhabdochlamydiaceae bacterium]|nr:BPL-N domain-containing protein [Rhabdochlamydiaceae bacterium]
MSKVVGSKVTGALQQQILVYAGKGAFEMNVKALTTQLRTLIHPSVKIQEVRSRFLKTENWEKNTLALVMGGGECTKWDHSLGEEGKKKIKDYVMGGGKFVGFCAAGYFCSAQSCFTLENKSPVNKERSIAFYPGKAIGPIVPTHDSLSPESARAMEVDFVFQNSSKSGALYYQSGCCFDIERSTQSTRIAGRYKSGAAAALDCDVGKGKAFLCGPHIEFSWTENLKAVSNRAFADLAEKLVPQESFRLQIWEEIGWRLSLPLKSALQ